VARVELSLRARLASAFNRYSTAWAAVETYRDVNVPKTQQAFDAVNEMYNQGRRPWMDVVEIKRALLDVKNEYTQHLLSLRKSEVEICGLLVVDGLEQPPSPEPGGHLDATPQPR
jgi:outer membrane protein TolC